MDQSTKMNPYDMSILTHPDHPMGVLQGAKPQWTIIREVDYRLVPDANGDLEFYYSGFTRDKRVNNSAELQALLNAISDPGYAFEGGESKPNPNHPYSSKLSLNGKRRLSYVILKLSKRAWKYSRNIEPFMIGTPGHEAGGYYNATRVTDKVAYFISDGSGARRPGDYAHAFNIYVELDVVGGQVMPIRIDPDVRHPGGSED